eukprot:12003502-Prorocentrum_lima.AAC.1
MAPPGIMRPDLQLPSSVVPKYRHEGGTIVRVAVHAAGIVHVEREGGAGDRPHGKDVCQPLIKQLDN